MINLFCKKRCLVYAGDAVAQLATIKTRKANNTQKYIQCIQNTTCTYCPYIECCLYSYCLPHLIGLKRISFCRKWELYKAIKMRGSKKFWPVVYIGCVMRYIFLNNNTLQFNTNAQVSYKMLQLPNQLAYTNRLPTKSGSPTCSRYHPKHYNVNRLSELCRKPDTAINCRINTRFTLPYR